MGASFRKSAVQRCCLLLSFIVLSHGQPKRQRWYYKHDAWLRNCWELFGADFLVTRGRAMCCRHPFPLEAHLNLTSRIPSILTSQIYSFLTSCFSWFLRYFDGGAPQKKLKTLNRTNSPKSNTGTLKVLNPQDSIPHKP